MELIGAAVAKNLMAELTLVVAFLLLLDTGANQIGSKVLQVSQHETKELLAIFLVSSSKPVVYKTAWPRNK
jgi:hypothetical protein